LSPAVNDPGTAINVIGTLLRLFAVWSEPHKDEDKPEPKYDRVHVPEVSVHDMFDDAFTATARDGAGVVEVAMRLQKALHSLTRIGDSDMRNAAQYHQKLALKRAQIALNIEEDFVAVQNAAKGAHAPNNGS
jgi:uncharacterized membrane protein